MAQLANEFSWSLSRHQNLKACARRYYFRHYKHWGGWADDAPAEVREIYRLTKLESRIPWQGSIVHRAIARSLLAARRGKPASDTEAAVAEAIGWMRQDFRDSRDDVARRTRDYKLHVRFVEHDIGLDDGSPAWRARWKESADTVEAALRWYFASEHYARLVAMDPADWLEIDDPASKVPASFELAGVKVHAKVDCAFREGGVPVALDWKAGRRDLPALPTTLAAMSLALAARHGVAPESVVVREVNVVTGRSQDHRVGREVLEVFREVFDGSVAAMRALLVDPAGNAARPEGDFATTEDDRECRYCTFRTVCPKVSTAF